MNKSTISTTLASRSLGSLLFSVGAPLTMQAISPDDLAARIGRSERMLIVDVRATSQYAQGHVPGAINIPVQSIAGKVGSLSRERPVVLFCASGARSGVAARVLKAAGFKDVVNAGGLGDLP